MRIAVVCNGLDVASRYESAQDLTCYRVTRGVIDGCQNMPFPKLPVGDMAHTLKSLGIDVLIVGGIQLAAKNLYQEEGIDVVIVSEGSPQEVASAYLTEKLWDIDHIA